MCVVEGCIINPYYNFKGERPEYCKRHAKDGMFNVKDKRCIIPDCKKGRLYGRPNEYALYCASHAVEGTYNKRSKQCSNTECPRLDIYNKIGERPMFCLEHKEDYMINVIRKKCLKCEYNARFNIPDEKPLYCINHKLDGMIETYRKKCKTHLCDSTSLKRYEGYCYYCFVHLFPDHIYCKNYKTKEKCVAEYIQSHSTYPWICDKKIQDGCSRRRPDLMVDLGFQVIIVEIDENQHIHYDTTCENKRMMELSQDVGHRPIVMIRFNPDEYTDTEKHGSCWCLDVHGLCQLKKSKEKEWNHRLDVLMEQINLWTTKPTEKTIEVIQLFYSE